MLVGRGTVARTGATDRDCDPPVPADDVSFVTEWFGAFGGGRPRSAAGLWAGNGIPGADISDCVRALRRSNDLADSHGG
jgi:hypothetical protein